jgi:hypothetical protein
MHTHTHTHTNTHTHTYAQVQELINKQAEWSEETKNFDGAVEMYIKVCTFDVCSHVLFSEP